MAAPTCAASLTKAAYHCSSPSLQLFCVPGDTVPRNVTTCVFVDCDHATGQCAPTTSVLVIVSVVTLILGFVAAAILISSCLVRYFLRDSTDTEWDEEEEEEEDEEDARAAAEAAMADIRF